MTVRFGNYRLAFYLSVFLLAGTVLGIGGHFANIFVPERHTAFSIYTIVVAALNIFIFLLTLQWSQPRVEAFVLFIFAVLWLSLGAWATDIAAGASQNGSCDELRGFTEIARNGKISLFSYCSEVKVIQAFSWALFAMFVSALGVLFQLISIARHFGRHHIWREPIRELPWFGEMPGYYNTHTSGVPGPMPFPSPSPYGSPYGYNAGGNAYMIQPGVNGAPPTITQVPVAPMSP